MCVCVIVLACLVILLRLSKWMIVLLARRFFHQLRMGDSRVTCSCEILFQIRENVLGDFRNIKISYNNNCPTRCNTKQSICYSASSLYMFRVSTTPIIRSTQNCNYSLRYWSYFCAAASLQRSQASLLAKVAAQKYDQCRRLYLQFCVLRIMGVVDTRNM